MKTFLILVGLGFLLGDSIVQAQTTTTTPTTRHRRFFPGAFGGGYGGGYDTYGYDSPDRATTPLQGIDYGVARILDARAMEMLYGSQAALNLSEVERREMDNWKKWIDTYFDAQRMNRDLRAAQRGRPMTPADYLRLSQMGKPHRLTPSEIDVITGQLTWPLLLQSTEFAPYRSTLEQVFSNRAYRGALGLDDYVKADRTTQAMMDVLKEQIEEVRPMDYVAARRFLDSLTYEARLPAAEGERSAEAPTLRR